MLVAHVLAAMAALSQSSVTAAESFNPPTLGPGTAMFNPRHWSAPVRVCGIPSKPAQGGPNTYILSDFHGTGLYVEVTTSAPTLDDPCVTGVILRTEGITEAAARHLGRQIRAVMDTDDDIRTLYECSNRQACQALVTATEQRSVPLLEGQAAPPYGAPRPPQTTTGR